MDWSTSHPVLVAAVTFGLMSADWLLTVVQEREKRAHHDTHYQTYPIDTTEGNPLLQDEVSKAKFINLRHALIALVLSAAVALAFMFIPETIRPLYLGYVWGLFLIVGTAHMSNLLGYRASRQGLHGELYVHQRTAYRIQAGRHAAVAALLIVLAAATASLFMAGVAVAGVTSAGRQLLWLRRLPTYEMDDHPAHETRPQPKNAEDLTKDEGTEPATSTSARSSLI